MNSANSRIKSSDFDAISLSVASPEEIKSWSYGEVTKPETINYRTQKPERDGLFCEKIFGPTKNWECYCGKYKRIRYKGIVCEKCGVEVTRSIVRRERMAHINLAVPVSHVWFLRSTPSRIGLILDLPIKTLEMVVYFAAYIVLYVDTEEQSTALTNLDAEFKGLKKQQQEESNTLLRGFREKQKKGEVTEKEFLKAEKAEAEKVEELDMNYHEARDELEKLHKGQVLGELEYREMAMKYGHVFAAGTGAESIKKLLEEIDFPTYISELDVELSKSSGAKQKKIIKRIKLAKSLAQGGIRPEWMILSKLPIIPPDLRPMVQLDGGRFAASDLNDLYRRVINRNNRLSRLLLIGSPEVISRNEKRMLQEAVDTLLNNSPRTGKAVFTTGERRKLRSLSDMLKGKQGRFRQNLLGKRVDYSGRSVIVVGPKLHLDECGLPKEMAMKLFKPFVIGELIRGEHSHNVKGAEKLIYSGVKLVWDFLEKVTKDRYVLLNRAPTLHRLGIQAFRPKLIEGKAIQIHPLVCAAFNADFDGDQMAVHVPLSSEAQAEARDIICAKVNIFKPSAGNPIVTPTQDMVLGCYYLTQTYEGRKGEGMIFGDVSEAINAYRQGYADLQARISIKIDETFIKDTTIGRVIFHTFFPKELEYKNYTFRKNDLESLISECFDKTRSIEATANFADNIKRVGFKFATKSGLSISAFDLKIPKEKPKILEAAMEKVLAITHQYNMGLITDNERYRHTILLWGKAKVKISKAMIENYEKDTENHIYCMIDSGARGNWGQITQLSGIKGLVANPGGRTIELPIRSNLLEGFTILEYFIATHGGRKGKSDTALKTAEAGYLTRRLVDAVQDIIIRDADCGADISHSVTRAESEVIGEAFENRIYGRNLTEEVIDPKTKEVIGKAREQIDKEMVAKMGNVQEVRVRSVMTCRTENGVCQQCYGKDLGSNKVVDIGTAVGIIAAQAIGEPGTQLTMRTFHMGGVAEGSDITQGLTRVEELFEARPPKTPAVLSEIAGKVHMSSDGEKVFITVTAEDLGSDTYKLPVGLVSCVEVGETVKERQNIAKSTISKETLKAKIGGTIFSVDPSTIVVSHTEKQVRSYVFAADEMLKVEDGEMIEAGRPITLGHFNLRDLMRVTETYTVQKYIVSEVQSIYASQGQTINDKHLEIIAKQMVAKVRIIDSGDSFFIPGEVVDYIRYLNANDALQKDGKILAQGERLLLGLTRVALATGSWLSAASFQETIRVLVEASTTKRIDPLNGLKENVIIGKLIPAGRLYKKAISK